MKITDASVIYRPQSKIIIDIPSAVSLFANADSFKAVIGTRIKALTKRWNDKYGKDANLLDDRSSFQEYIPIASHQKLIGNGGDRKTKSSMIVGDKTLDTELLLVLSNWRFLRDIEHQRALAICRTEDCTVGLKFTSSAFKWKESAAASAVGDEGGETTNQSSQYPFDRNGVTFPYQTFIALLSDHAVTNVFMQNVKRRYEDETGETIDSTNDGIGERRDEEEEEEEEEEREEDAADGGESLKTRKVSGAAHAIIEDYDTDVEVEEKNSNKGKGKGKGKRSLPQQKSAGAKRGATH